MIRHLSLIVMSALVLAGCDGAAGSVAASQPGIGANGRRDLIGANVNIGGEKQGQTYATYDDSRDRRGTGLAFAGYGCQSNCADVMGGYQRARRAKVTDARLCAATTWGELEGCVAFAQGHPSELSSLPPLRETAAP